MILNILRVIGLLQLFGTIALVIHCQINWDGELPDEDDDDYIDWP